MEARTLQISLMCLLAVEALTCPDTCLRCARGDRCDSCRAGWQLHRHTCVDVDECDDPGLCPASSYCINTEGSFKCRDCDRACVGCMGSGPARCRRCSSGYRLTGAKCSDVDECSDLVLACPGLDQICVNSPGSFRCRCADGFVKKDGGCVRKKVPGRVQEKGLFEDIQDEEVEVLQQMFFGTVLCALGTLAAKGDLVYTSVFVGAAAGMAGYWLSDKGERLMQNLVKG